MLVVARSRYLTWRDAEQILTTEMDQTSAENKRDLAWFPHIRM